MCGRFDLHSPPLRWAALLGARFDARLDTCVLPSYNVTPGHVVLVAVAHESSAGGRHDAVTADDGIQLDTAVWGVPAPWTRPQRRPSTLHNARAETLATKAPFRHLLARGRCLVAADGFYEWRADSESGRRQPFYFSRGDGQPLMFAGLRTLPDPQCVGPSTHGPTSRSTTEHSEMPPPRVGATTVSERDHSPWRPTTLAGDRAPATSCTVVTTAANEDVAGVHHRMPAVLDVGGARRWLGVDHRGHQAPDTSIPDLAELMVPAGTLVARAVPLLVNNPRHDGPELLAEVSSLSHEDAPRLFG